MKSLTTNVRIWALAVAMLAMAIPSLGQASKQTPDPQQPSTQTQTPSTETSAGSQSMQTFQGIIGRADSGYVLKDSTGAVYQLDDQKKAKDFSGQNVKVTGALDSATSTIHVASIAPAS